MLYIDTCVLLALLTPEGHSAAAATFLAQARAPLAISGWSITELHSALGLKVRTKALSPSQAEAVLQGFERNLAPGLLVLTLEPQDFRNANACLRGWTTTLRAADALHLAIASGRGATLCSLDAPFVAAAQQLGLDAQLLGAGNAS
jgi:predicted nucleic acid-binding protein